MNTGIECFHKISLLYLDTKNTSVVIKTSWPADKWAVYSLTFATSKKAIITLEIKNKKL